MPQNTYRLLRGIHVMGRGVNRKTYKRGDRITTDKDLLKFNSPRVTPKFELLFVGRGDAEEARASVGVDTNVDDGLETMSVAELKRLAESEEIELGGASRKDDIISVIRMAMADADE